MNRKYVLFLACCAASCFAACNESAHMEYPCEEGLRSCHFDTIVVCKDGKEVVETQCQNGLLCDPSLLECGEVFQLHCSNEDARKCLHNYLLVCRGGEWQLLESCGQAQTCNAVTSTCDGGNEPETCSPDGARKCDDNRVMVCEDGTWNAEKTCSETETCNDVTFECDSNVTETCDEDGARKCDDNRVMVCEDGTWNAEKTCSETETCNDVTFECDSTVTETCDEDGAKRCPEDASQIEICTGGVWSVEDCHEGTSCVTTDNGSLCAECQNDDTRCVVEDGVSLLSKCVNYSWAEAEACLETDAEKLVCDANPGKSCVNVLELLQCPEDGTVACQDVYGQEYAVICENGVVTEASGICENGQVCYVPEGGCTTPDVCGNEKVGAGEDCEAGMMGEDCVTVTGDSNASGELACVECKYDLTNCMYCGDGVVNNSEACDGSVPEDATCTSVINDGKNYTGILTCKDDCTFDLSNCREEILEGCTPENCTTTDPNATAACVENVCKVTCNEGFMDVEGVCTSTACTAEDTKCSDGIFYLCGSNDTLEAIPMPEDGKHYICNASEGGWIEVACTEVSHCTAPDHATMACNENICEVASCEGNWSVATGKDACECTGDYVLNGDECIAKCTSADTKCEDDNYYQCEETGLVTTNAKPTDGKHYICNASEGGWIEVACTEVSHCTAPDHATMACNENICEVASCEGNWSVKSDKSGCECTGDYVLNGDECVAKCTSADTKCEGDNYYKCEESGLVTTNSKPTDGKHYICNASEGGWVEVACTESSHCTAPDHATMACNAEHTCEVASCEGNWSVTTGKSGCECTGDYVLNGDECVAKCTSADTKCEGDNYYKCEESGLVTTNSKPTDGKHYICNASEGGWVEVACTESSHCTAPDHATMACSAEHTCEVASCEGNWSVTASKDACECTGEFVVFKGDCVTISSVTCTLDGVNYGVDSYACSTDGTKRLHCESDGVFAQIQSCEFGCTSGLCDDPHNCMDINGNEVEHGASACSTEVNSATCDDGTWKDQIACTTSVVNASPVCEGEGVCGFECNDGFVKNAAGTACERSIEACNFEWIGYAPEASADQAVGHVTKSGRSDADYEAQLVCINKTNPEEKFVKSANYEEAVDSNYRFRVTAISGVDPGKYDCTFEFKLASQDTWYSCKGISYTGGDWGTPILLSGDDYSVIPDSWYREYIVQLCTPGSKVCDGSAQYKVCDSEGLSYGAAEACLSDPNGVASCSGEGECTLTCNEGYKPNADITACLPVICTPNAVTCNAGVLSSCNANGTEMTTSSCPTPDHATASCNGNACDFVCDYGYEKDSTGTACQAGFAVGSIVTFGHYEQDNNISNGKEPVTWIVLDRNETGQYLVLSKKALDVKPYNITNVSVTWETSTIRSWLNGYGANYNTNGANYTNDNFIDKAFTADEKLKIATSYVEAHAYSSTKQGNSTMDKIFLLSHVEAKKYLTSSSQIKAQATNYAVANGAKVTTTSNQTYYGSCPNNTTCYSIWWLRTQYPDNKAAIDIYDKIGSGFQSVSYTFVSVRPAMWVDL